MPGRNEPTDGPMFMNANLWKFWYSAEQSIKLSDMDLKGARGRSVSPQVNFNYNGDLTDAANSKHYLDFMKYAETVESGKSWEFYQSRLGCHKEEGKLRDSMLTADDTYSDLKQYSDSNGKWNKLDHRNKMDLETYGARKFNYNKIKSELLEKERSDMGRSLSYSTDRAESRSHAYRDHRSHSSYIPSFKVCFLFLFFCQSSITFITVL